MGKQHFLGFAWPFGDFQRGMSYNSINPTLDLVTLPQANVLIYFLWL